MITDIKLVVLLLGVIAALIYSLKSSNAICVFIVVVQVVSIVLTLTINRTIGYYIFGSSIILTFLYPFLNRSMARKNGMWVWVFILPIFLAFIFGSFELPGANFVKLIMLVPITVFVYAIFHRKRFQYEISFMIIFFADALIRFSGIFY